MFLPWFVSICASISCFYLFIFIKTKNKLTAPGVYGSGRCLCRVLVIIWLVNGWMVPLAWYHHHKRRARPQNFGPDGTKYWRSIYFLFFIFFFWYLIVTNMHEWHGIIFCVLSSWLLRVIYSLTTHWTILYYTHTYCYGYNRYTENIITTFSWCVVVYI